MSEELDRLAELEATATPAPWDYVEGRTLLHIETHIDHPSGAGIPICSIPLSKRADADLIVDLRNAAPALLAAAREAEELLEWQREAAGILRMTRITKPGEAPFIDGLLARVKP